MNNIEQMKNFIKALKSHTHMLLDDSVGGTIRTMIEPEIKDPVEKMCLNEYRSKCDRSVKIETIGTPKGMLVVDTHTAVLAQIELLNKKLVESGLGKANMSQVQALRCDFMARDIQIEDALWKDQVKRINSLIFIKITLIPTPTILDGKIIKISNGVTTRIQA